MKILALVVCLYALTACASPMPPSDESDPVPLGRIGMDAARVAMEMGLRL